MLNMTCLALQWWQPKNTGKGLVIRLALRICHTYTEDGRCVLLKILLTNFLYLRLCV
jgi:predicted DNA-binding helix-hairpin-helix protein